MNSRLVRNNDLVITNVIKRQEVSSAVGTEYAKSVIANQIMKRLQKYHEIDTVINLTKFIIDNINISSFIETFDQELTQSTFKIIITKYVEVFLEPQEIKILCDSIVKDLVLII